MVSFHIDGLPEPLPIRDRQTGNVVDGYRITVVSNDTGARAVLEIPKSRMSADEVQREAEDALGKLDAAIAAFPRPAG